MLGHFLRGVDLCEIGKHCDNAELTSNVRKGVDAHIVVGPGCSRARRRLKGGSFGSPMNFSVVRIRRV